MAQHKRYVFIRWNGGANYATPTSDDIERVETITRGKEKLYDRAMRGAYHKQTFDYVYRAHANVYTPNADDGAYIDVVTVRALSLADACVKAQFQFDLGAFSRYELRESGTVRKVA